jgi:hypothetical protein
LNHVFYSDGNAKKVAWVIETEDSKINQNRNHIDIYTDKVTDLQSKYVALHIGLFWGIGVFIIKNQDSIKIKLDDEIMFNQFTTNTKIDDEFIQKRIQFIKQLVKQRKLKIQFELISMDKNLAKNKI